MKLFAHTGSALKEFMLEKGVEALLIMSDVKVDDMATEKINLIIDRNGRDNTNITPSSISLKRFILGSTYGSDAITSFPAGVDGAYETVAICELTEDGSIHLEGNDKLKITLSGLDPAKNYVVYGLESPNVSAQPFVWEEKNVLASTVSATINTSKFDMMVLEDNATIENIDFKYANGRTCTYERTELRAIAQDIDPIAAVRKNGTVTPAFVDLIQMPLLHVEEITIRKTNADDVDITFRVDLDQDENYG